MLQIPSLITETVLKYAASEGFNTYPGWKYKLRLLSICKEWRYLGKKMVYDSAFISDTTEYSYFSNQELPNLNNQPLQTNLDLILQTGNKACVKKLDLLLIQSSSNFLEILEMLQRILFEDKKDGCWRNIRELNIRWFRDDDDGFDENSGLVQEVIGFSNRLINSLPGIKKLYMRKYDSDRTTMLMFNQLANRYSSQLRYLYSSSALRFALNSSYESLTHLRIPYETPSNSSLAIPKIMIERLQVLELFNINRSFSWNKLLGSANGHQQISVFPSLRYLKLVFGIFDTNQMLDESNESKDACKPMSISFPSLDTLIVNGNYASCSHIIIQRYPRHMKKVDLQLNATSLFLMKQIGLKYIDDLSISVFTLTDSEEEIFYNSTNYFFGSDLGNQENEDLGPICKKSNFVLNSLSYMLNPKMIAWSNISSITFTGTVRVSVLLKILKRVKTLEKLVVWSLDMDMDIDVVTSEKSLDASGHSSLSALNTSIRSLSIFDFKKTDASYCIGQNMLNVVLALPQLQRLISAEIVIESIKKYMQCRRTSGSGECIGSVCSCDMTHLSNIELIKT